jgi:hypothetical protein
MPKTKSKIILCEKCNDFPAVIIHNHNYYCAECALFIMNIPYKKAKSIEDANLSNKIQ